MDSKSKYLHTKLSLYFDVVTEMLWKYLEVAKDLFV